MSNYVDVVEPGNYSVREREILLISGKIDAVKKTCKLGACGSYL
jgi:hypothetical protein